MTDFTSLLEQREGRTLNDILGGVARDNLQGDRPRQHDLLEQVAASKGAVSNACRRLVDAGLLNEREDRYEIDKTALLELYREHLEPHLMREPAAEGFSDEVALVNDCRTELNRLLPEALEEQAVVYELLLRSFNEALRSPRQQTLRETLRYTDELIADLSRRIATSEDLETSPNPMPSTLRVLFLIALATQRPRTALTSLENDAAISPYLPGNPPENQMIELLERGADA